MTRQDCGELVNCPDCGAMVQPTCEVIRKIGVRDIELAKKNPKFKPIPVFEYSRRQVDCECGWRGY
jgi:hypothetical protein